MGAKNLDHGLQKHSVFHKVFRTQSGSPLSSKQQSNLNSTKIWQFRGRRQQRFEPEVRAERWGWIQWCMLTLAGAKLCLTWQDDRLPKLHPLNELLVRPRDVVYEAWSACNRPWWTENEPNGTKSTFPFWSEPKQTKRDRSQRKKTLNLWTWDEKINKGRRSECSTDLLFVVHKCLVLLDESAEARLKAASLSASIIVWNKLCANKARAPRSTEANPRLNLLNPERAARGEGGGGGGGGRQNGGIK